MLGTSHLLEEGGGGVSLKLAKEKREVIVTFWNCEENVLRLTTSDTAKMYKRGASFTCSMISSLK